MLKNALQILRFANASYNTVTEMSFILCLLRKNETKERSTHELNYLSVKLAMSGRPLKRKKKLCVHRNAAKKYTINKSSR